MKISFDEIVYVAKLSKLNLDKEQVEYYNRSLNDIINCVDKLAELNVEGIQPTVHVLVVDNVFREDVVTPSMPVAEILKNAPDAQDGCFHVPQVVEG